MPTGRCDFTNVAPALRLLLACERIMGAPALVVPDEQLDYWGDQFSAAAHLHERLTFEQFIRLPAHARAQLLLRDCEVEAVEVQAERGLGLHCHLAGALLVEPVRPPTRRFHRPWFFGRRR